MITYMDFIQQCFYSSTGWSWDNTYENILETPRNLLAFPIPNGVNIVVSNRNTKYNYSSINISQVDTLEGSLSYLSSSTDLDEYYKSSRVLPINNVLQGYRDLSIPLRELSESEKNNKPFLLYGKMYFPSHFIEGMLVKRFTPNYQLVIKFVNTPKLNKLTQPTSIFTFYLQRQTENSAHDFVYSTREDLFGFRCLHHYNLPNSPNNSNANDEPDFISSKLRSNTTSYPSTFSAGCELWYSVGSVSPGVSVAVRYSTYLDSMRYLINSLPTHKPTFINTSSNPYLTKSHPTRGNQTISSIPYAISTIHPLTFTIAMNPLLGTVESTYAIKSDLHYKKTSPLDNENFISVGKLGLVLSSKYQFNIYSYNSDLILGAQILRSKIFSLTKSEVEEKKKLQQATLKAKSTREGNAKIGEVKNNIANKPNTDSTHQRSHISQHNVVYKVTEDEYNESNITPLNIENDSSTIHEEIPMELLPKTDNDDYISSFKISGSLNEKKVRLAWEGKFQDWFISSGASVDLKTLGAAPKVLKYGVEFAYNS